MRTTKDIYDSLVAAPCLETAVRDLSDDELRQVRGSLARGDRHEWPASLIEGVCIVVGCERFMNPGPRMIFIRPKKTVSCDYGHGSEVQS